MPKPTAEEAEKELSDTYAAFLKDNVGSPARWNPYKEPFNSVGLKDWQIEAAKNQADLIKVSSFLVASDNLFWEGIGKLEDAMSALFEQRLGVKPAKIPSFAHGRANINPGGVDPTKHLLTEVLTLHENKENFAPVEKSSDNFFHPMSFWGVLDNASFAASIRTKNIGKDYVAGDHGEYTHRIQWYCIGAQKQSLGLMSKDMGTLFSRSGISWGRLFDRQAIDATDAFDFRRPERLNRWLTDKVQGSSGKAYPMLHAFLGARANKMGGGFTLPLKVLKVAKRWYQIPLPPNFNTMLMKDVKTYLIDQKGLTKEQVAEIENFMLARGGAPGKILDGQSEIHTFKK